MRLISHTSPTRGCSQIGVRAEDKETNEEFNVYSKVVVNCAGAAHNSTLEGLEFCHLQAGIAKARLEELSLDTEGVTFSGPLADSVRKMDKQNATSIVVPAAGKLIFF